MKLIVIGTGSTGNCYALQTNTETLLIEAGTPLSEVKKALDFNVRNVVGCIISHEHGDHAKFVNEMIGARIPIYTSGGTKKALKRQELKTLNCGVVAQIGSFKVLPFNVKHDAKEPFGYLINHEDSGNILFATDTYLIPNTFKNLNQIMIECNYDETVLRENFKTGKLPDFVCKRVLMSHFGFGAVKDLLQANDISNVNNIVLIHLSENNSDRKKFKTELETLTLKNITIAKKGTNINFDKTPF